jgi:phosphatidylinositol glycan class T
VADNPIPRPVPYEDLKCDTSKPYHSHDTCYPLDEADSDWSLSQIFGRPIKGSCPLSEEDWEDVCINIPHARDVYVSGGPVERKDQSGYLRCYKLMDQNFEMVLPPQNLQERAPLEQPLLYADRSFTGYGQERGGVQAILQNPSMTNAVDFVYLESLPWFMKLYLHTLKVKINGKEGDLIQEMYYRPALDRRRGTQLEIHMNIPANSTAVLTYDFEKAILRYTEYPPDANRGFDVPAAVITIGNVSVRTTSLLLPLPTPDFSMPYNVIILTSTVMALAFGSIFKLLIGRFVAADEAQQWDVKAVRLIVLSKLRMLMKRFSKDTKVEKTE